MHVRQRRRAPGGREHARCLELAGRSDIEVALGRETPLVRPLRDDAGDARPAGHRLRRAAGAERRPVSDRHAADLIIAEARRRPGEVTLVTLAPLTNLAVACCASRNCRTCSSGWSSWPAPIARRAIRLPPANGTLPSTRTRRRWCSRPSERARCASARRPRPRRDRAREVPPGTHDGLARRAGSRPDESLPVGREVDSHGPEPRSMASNPVLRFIDDALRFYMEFHSRYDGFYGAFIHDPLAVATALDPALLITEALTVQVELDGTLTSGETVTDWRRVWGRPPERRQWPPVPTPTASWTASSSGSAAWPNKSAEGTQARPPSSQPRPRRPGVAAHAGSVTPAPAVSPRVAGACRAGRG